MKYQVQETTVINAPLDKVTPLICNLSHWPKWSPWLCLETAASCSFEDDNQTMRWCGKVIGEGSLSIHRSSNESFHVDLEFIKPFKSKASACLSWVSDGEQATVTWVMNGNMPWFLFFMVPMIKGLVRMDYRRGLARLKAVSETGSVDCKLHLHKQKDRQQGFTFVGVKHNNVPMTGVDNVIGPSFTAIKDTLPATENSCYICFCDKADIGGDSFDLSIGIAYYGTTPALPEGNWDQRDIPNHSSIHVKHQGPYDHIADAWAMLVMSARALKLKPLKTVPDYEKYIVSPADSDSPSAYKTEVHYPVKG